MMRAILACTLALVALLVLLPACTDLHLTHGSYDGAIQKGQHIGPWLIHKVRLTTPTYDTYVPCPWAGIVVQLAELHALECKQPGAFCTPRLMCCDPPGSGKNWQPYNAIIAPSLKIQVSSIAGGMAVVKMTW